MKIIFEKHLSTRKPPVNITNVEISLFQHEFEKKIRNTHVIKISNGFILNNLIIKFGCNLKKYLTYSFVHVIINNKGLIKRILLFRRLFKTIETGVWITDDWSLAYFHWLTDSLPRLLASKRNEEQYPVLLPEYYKQNSFVSESLNLLGEQVIYYDTSIPLRVKKLLITSHTANTGNYNILLINELREKFLINCKTLGERKIFISRLKAQKRKIMNEPEVITLLESFGYEIHYFEDYSFEKQIEIVSQTKQMIGLHGAGLTNILFMREGGKVLELRNQNDGNNNCYFSLASDLNLKYYYQLNQCDTIDTHTADFIVDIDMLRKNIESMG